MELQILAATLKHRPTFEKLHAYIDPSVFSHPFKTLYSITESYYKQDPDAKSVDKELLFTAVKNKLKNPKHEAEYQTLVDRAYGFEVSEPNVERVVLDAKAFELETKLSIAGQNHDPEAIADLLEEYVKVSRATSLDDLGAGQEVMRGVSLEDLLQNHFDDSKRLKLYPGNLNRRVDGGLLPGHHALVYARPEAGKTLTATNLSAGFCGQGKPGLYIGNEDRIADVVLRHVCNMTGWDKYQVMQNPKAAEKLAYDRGYGNLTIISMAPGSMPEVRDAIEKYDPEWIVLDQLRNFRVRSENRTTQLEKCATEARNIAKEAEIVVVSLTQAGDSAENKLVLEQGDVDSSNTGIPGQVDLMIGIGVNKEFEERGERMINLPKNKISGIHEHFPVKVIPALSRMLSI